MHHQSTDLPNHHHIGKNQTTTTRLTTQIHILERKRITKQPTNHYNPQHNYRYNTATTTTHNIAITTTHKSFQLPTFRHHEPQPIHHNDPQFVPTIHDNPQKQAQLT